MLEYHFIPWKVKAVALGRDCVCALTGSVVSYSLRPYGLWPARLLCPWDSPGKNAGVGCHALLQRIFLTRDQTCVSFVSIWEALGRDWFDGLVPKSYLTLATPWYVCSLLCSSVHGILQARILE